MANKILTAGERLFPPVKESNLGIFHYHKGRVARIPSGLTPKAKAVGLVTKRSESFVKCDKASKGIKTAHHMHEAADYIARNGKVDLEDENGNTLSRDDLHSTVKDWCTDQEVPETQEDLLKTKKGEKRPADARRIVISCPKGSDPEAVKKAAKEFAEEFFKANGYRYVFGLHCKSEETPNEPDHPHIHFLIKSVSIDGKRLNIRKADLQLMRERFAIIARKYGIELNATSRTVRGESEKAKNIERYHHEKRQADYKHQKAHQTTDKEHKKTGTSDSEQIMARALMTPDELRRMDNDLCIIYEKGLKPIKAKKYYYFETPMIKKLNEYRLNHLEFDVGNRGEWRKFNPNNPYVAEEENKAKDLKVDSLDDLFADDANQDNNKNKEEIKTETKTANTQNIADAPMLPDDEEFAYDIQKELEAKFDELFGTENVANKTN